MPVTIDPSAPAANDTAGLPLLEQLASAEKALQAAQQHVDDYDGNNPDKHRAALASATLLVTRLTTECKRKGLLATSAEERVSFELDGLHPKAQSRQVVEHSGKYYQKRFTPLKMSRTRDSVTAWESHWEQLPLTHPQVVRLLNPQATAENDAMFAAVRKHWPWSVPAGGLVLKITVGAPTLVAVSEGKATVGFTKGRPDLRKRLTAEIQLTEEALKRCRSRPRALGAKTLYLGKDAQGRECHLAKSGRAAVNLELQTKA